MPHPEENEKVLYTFNNTEITFANAEMFPSEFSNQAKLFPERVAVITELESLTYSQLEVKSNHLAAYLLSKGLAKEEIIGICLDRSIEMMVSILATLKAGGAYLPIDPDYPADRIVFMLDDAGVKIVLTNSSTLGKINEPLSRISGLNSVIVDEDWEQVSAHTLSFPRIQSHDLAYVIYTSGSTGKPKGVLTEHYALANRLKWAQSHFHLQAEDIILQKTTICFDVSVWELLWPLMVGCTVMMAKPGGQKDPVYLQNVIDQQKVTTIHFVPSMLEMFLQEIETNSCQGLKRVLCSGEELTLKQANSFREKLPHVALHNLYGPTETAIDVTCYDVPEQTEKIFIGKPIANTSLYILDEHMNPCETGITGELYIGGCQVARGYLNRPELNSYRFLLNPYTNSEHNRLYRTGDLARWHPSGNLEYLGRSDDQVKIRGFRIELGEIENVILQYDGVAQCVVVAKAAADGMKKLVGYIVNSSSQFDKASLRAHLNRQLPDYMVPDHLLEIEKVPLSENGKIDRNALPEPGTARPDLNVLFKAPVSPMEKLLSSIWSSLLQIDKIGINDNFFDLGGNSLLALRFVSVLLNEHKLSLPVTRLYQYPYIKQLSVTLSGKECQ